MISVVMTAYNAEKYIAQSVRSILRQSDADLECIVVDDGSTDCTHEIASGFKDKRVRSVKAGKVGRGRALNLGWRMAMGEYIAIQDADDISHQHRLQIERHIFELGEGNLAGIGSGQVRIHGNGQCHSFWNIPNDLSVSDIGQRIVFRNPISHTSMLFRKSALEAVSGYDESREDLFDWDLMVRLCSQGFMLSKIDAPLVAHRIHENQFFEGRKRLSYALHCMEMQRMAIRKLKCSLFLYATLPPLFAYRILRRW